MSVLDKQAIILNAVIEQQEKVSKLHQLFKRVDVDEKSLPYIIRQLVHITIDDCCTTVAKEIKAIDPRFDSFGELKKEIRKQLTLSFLEFCHKAYQV